MKKLLIAAIAAVSLVGMQAMAAVALHIDANDLLDNTGGLCPTTTVGLWIVDTSGGTSLSPVLTLGEDISLGTLLAGTSDRVIEVTDGTIVSQPGYLGLDAGGTYGSSPNVGVGAGQKFGIIWLVNQALATTTAEAGYYGEFNDAAGVFSTPPWVTPADGQTVSYDMTTMSQGGSVPNAAGLAALQIVGIPEPSSIMLVLVGLLGGMGLIRRRR